MGSATVGAERKKPAARAGKIGLLPLITATYFMVSGGPYGIEDIMGKAGYGRALLLLLLVPVFWSLPTSLMVGELASALPVEGGYYCWVRRALGSFWGFQEAWLSLAASVFDMAIYPTIFVLYLGKVEPGWTAGHSGTVWALGVVVACAVWNLRGVRAVGDGSVGMFCILAAPFVVLVVAGFLRGFGEHAAGAGMAALRRPVGAPDIAGAVLVTLWNYMGWDNASTVAQEVENPQRNYPRAMATAAALVALTYVLPLAAVGVAGIPADRFSTGSWTDAARVMLGPTGWGAALVLAIVAGGMLNGLGMFNALTLSYTRVPYALAEEGLLPRTLARGLRRRTAKGVPWLSVLLCSGAWALALRFTFERLISIDLVLYGAALVLEFVALVVLRVREPGLARPFRVPGGVWGAVGVGLGPTVLIGYAMWAARGEQVAGVPALGFAALVAGAGPLVYAAARWGERRRAARTATLAEDASG
jgi:amino acid transporter